MASRLVQISRQELLDVGRGRDDLRAAGLRDGVRVVVLALVGVDVGGGRGVGDDVGPGRSLRFGYGGELLKGVFFDLLQDKNITSFIIKITLQN